MSRSEEVHEVISLLCGWIYVLLWSLSYYTQPILNYRRRSTKGLAFDWPYLNVFGAACYAVSSTLFLYSTPVREEYAARHPDAPEPTIRFNDLCFGLHSLLLCSITASQFWPALWRWEGSKADRTVSLLTNMVFWGGLLSIVVATCIASLEGARTEVNRWGWINVAYTMGDIKLVVTIAKFIPQIISNHKRKSTSGLAISGVLLDLGGGIFSHAQLFIDSTKQGDWSGVVSNPAKFGLANLSMISDAILIMQHYLLYGSGVDSQTEGNLDTNRTAREADSLLPKNWQTRESHDGYGTSKPYHI